jgi:hypothetical protein
MKLNDSFSPCCVTLNGRDAGAEVHPVGSWSVTSPFNGVGFWFSTVTVNSFSRFPFSGTIAMFGLTVSDIAGTAFNAVRCSPSIRSMRRY